MRILPAQTRALLGRTNPRAFSVDPDRLRVPDTMIAREAEALCSEVYTQALLNHCLRSYAWGTILAERDGLEHDPELFYVTCLLHDLGVTDRYRDTVTGQACFAATAATVARDWSRERGWREPRCTALADAICQHLNPQVRPEHGIEAHLMQAGAGFDVVGDAPLGGGHAHRPDRARSPSPARLQEVVRQRHVRPSRSAPRHEDPLPLSLHAVRSSHQPSSLRRLTPGFSNQGAALMSDEPSPAKLTAEFSSTTADSRTEPHMSRTHHRKSLRQHLADLHGHGKSPSHKDSELHGHTDGSGHRHRHHTDGAADATPAQRAHARPGAGRLLLLVCVAQLMVILDITAVNVALPQLADGLHINSSDIGWTITSYSLIFGSLLLLGGRAADLIGRRRMFLTGLGIFTAASVASALAASSTVLFAARAGQGLGAAMLSPAALLDHHGHVHRRP